MLTRSSQRHNPRGPCDENPVSTMEDLRGNRGVLDAHHGSTQARHDYGVGRPALRAVWPRLLEADGPPPSLSDEAMIRRRRISIS